MRPKQVWIPTFPYSLDFDLVRRDAQRAFEVWKGEDRVFFLPGLEQTMRWKEGADDQRGSLILAIPAEHFDIADVLHIGANGYAGGLGSWERFPLKLDQMLDAWLNVPQLGGVEIFPAPDEVSVPAPFFDRDEMHYEMVSVRLEPGPTMEVADVSRAESERIVSFKWPPEGHHVRPISPEVESAQHYGPFARVEFEGISILQNRRDQDLTSFHVIHRWPEPLRRLFPYGGGIDALHHQALMRQVAEVSSGDPRQALEDARRSATLYVGECQSPIGKTWLEPVTRELAEDKLPPQDIVLRALSIGLTDARTIEEARASEAWRKKLGEASLATRVWGPVGLFWASLIERLEAHRGFRVCERCKRVNDGDVRKRFCSKQDDPKCYKARRASDRAGERSRRKRRGVTSDNGSAS